MKTTATETAPPSMTVFGWFIAIYSGAFVAAAVGLGWLLIASWIRP